MVTEQKMLDNLASRAFSIIELCEVAGVQGSSLQIIRKKLLDLGNDIKRLGDHQTEDGDE